MTNLDIIIERATDVLGNHDRALEWVDHVSGTLGGSPSALSNTDEGRDRVLLHLAGILRSIRD